MSIEKQLQLGLQARQEGDKHHSFIFQITTQNLALPSFFLINHPSIPTVTSKMKNKMLKNCAARPGWTVGICKVQ